MITLYCSNKLQKYIGFTNNQIEQQKHSLLNSWNAHIFTLNRKKCLFFINHDTYFSFVVYAIKKPDIKRLDELFIKGFINELNKFNLITGTEEVALKDRFAKVFLHKSINNRKVIGTMNNLIQILECSKDNYENIQDYLAQDTFLNSYLLKKDDQYFEAKDVIKPKINQLFTHLHIEK